MKLRMKMINEMCLANKVEVKIKIIRLYSFDGDKNWFVTFSHRFSK